MMARSFSRSRARPLWPRAVPKQLRPWLFSFNRGLHSTIRIMHDRGVQSIPQMGDFRGQHEKTGPSGAFSPLETLPGSTVLALAAID